MFDLSESYRELISSNFLQGQMKLPAYCGEFHFRRGLINVPIRQETRPAKAKYINSFDGSMVLIKFSTMDSAGVDIYLAATEDTMIRAKIADQMIMLEKCFI